MITDFDLLWGDVRVLTATWPEFDLLRSEPIAGVRLEEYSQPAHQWFSYVILPTPEVLGG